MDKKEKTSATSQNRSRGRPRAFYDKTEESTIKALERGVKILSMVSEEDGATLSEIAETAGESAATTYRTLLTLQKDGLVEFIENGQLWCVGVTAFRIGNAFLRRTNLMERSQPVMQRVMAESGETANLAVIDQAEVVFVSQVETHQPIRAFFRPGTRGPAHASGIGKALLAFRPGDEVDALFLHDVPDRFTDKTIIEREALLDELVRIRERGWAVDDEERTEGMRCIAAPIFNAQGEAIAGISISGPSVRVDQSREQMLGQLISEAGREVTRLIGGMELEDVIRLNQS